jgi:drug/metabolite transporter (DMT)-like permease
VSHRALRLLRHDAAMLLVCVIWGTNFTVQKLAFSALSPLAFTAIRFVLGSVLLAAIVRGVEGPGRVPRGPLLFRLVWLGVFGNTLYQIGFVTGLAESSATNTALIIAASPAVVAILGAVLGLERTTVRMGFGIAIGIGGVALIVLSGGAHRGLRAAHGDLFTLGAVLSWAIYTLGLRNLDSISALRITAWTTYTGTPGLVLAAIPELLHTNWRGLHAGVAAAMAYSVVISLALAYLLWNRSVRAVGGTRTAIYMCVTPLIASLVAWAYMGEKPGLQHLAGGALIACGVVLTRLKAGSPPQE